MKRILVIVLALVLGMSMLAGCGAKEDSVDEKAKPEPGRLGFGDTALVTAGFEIVVLDDVQWSVFENHNVPDMIGKDVFSVPFQITNPNDSPGMLSDYAYKTFAPAGNESVFIDEQYKDTVLHVPNLNKDETGTVKHYTAYEGDGEYVIVFEYYNEKYEVCIDIKKPAGAASSTADTEAASSTAGTGTDASTLVGTWTLRSALDIDGTTYSLEELESFGLTGVITLNDDKTVMINLFGVTAPGSWSSDDNKTVVLTLIDEEYDEEEELVFVLEGDSLVMDDEEGSKMYFTK